jgi:hypothetical protein
MEGEADMLDVEPGPTRTIRNPAEHPYKEVSASGGAGDLPGAAR